MYVLINRENVVVDILNDVRYIKLQSGTGITIACPENEGTGVIGSDFDTHYALAGAAISSSIDDVKVMQFDELPEGCKPNYWVYNNEKATLEPRYQTPAEKRENAYETASIVEWGEGTLTVDEGNRLWQAYTAEGKVAVAQELTAAIAAAKDEIRKMYPDEN